MKAILLPTDFSKNSINAINYAMELYKNVPCVFYILNVQKTSSFISDDIMVANASATIYNTIVDAAKKSITNIIAKIEARYNNEKHQFKTIVDYDNFVDSINQVSKKYKIDLIIMGTKGASGLKKVLFGSNTVHVIKRSNVAVLAIPDNCKFSGLEKIAFTTSFKKLYKKDDFNLLSSMVSLNYSKLYVLHVICDDAYSDELNSGIDFFKSNFRYPIFKYLQVNDNDVYKAVHEFAVTNAIKMIAMTVNKYSFFERLFNKHAFENMAYNIDIPFLVMKNSQN
ncbi:Universal stress protein family protein [Mariniflexile rhizosphaerae]|uniref:universal stress protein n=1 Tax=unclassified Mariniflexile TaxID=2643887 RepID=UPI000E333E2A|nr:universal stress protein [Mariniflexile sp. TRM1-10]AXP82906.1 Universal stress protein family protein [Mariniflexile sp. TRM1-10]